MSDDYFRRLYDRWSATGVGTNAGVTVTKTAVTGRRHVVFGVQCSGDAAALVTVESPSGTVLWRKRFAAAFNNGDAAFPVGGLIGASGSDLLVKISASTANCEANMQGASV